MVVRPDDAGHWVAPTPVVQLRSSRRERSPADVLRLLVALVMLAAGVLAATVGRNTIGVAEADVVEAYHRIPDRVAELLTAVAVLLAVALPVLALVVLLVRRHVRRVLALVLGSAVAAWAMVGLDRLLGDSAGDGRLAGLPDTEARLTDPGFATSPFIAAAVAMVVIGSPWLPRQWRRAFWGLVAVLVVLRIVSPEPAFNLVLALAVGLTVGSLALIAIGTPNTDPGRVELLGMLGNQGPLARVTQLPATDPLAYEIETAAGARLALTVRTSRDRSADLLDRLLRYAQLRGTETDRPFTTIERRVEHEALAQALAAEAGVRLGVVHAVVASPEGAVGLLTDDVPGRLLAHLAPDELTAGPLLDAWRQVDQLHRAGIAHRSLGPASVRVTSHGCAVLGRFDDARLAAPPRDRARDVAQMLVAGALLVGTETSVRTAVDALGADGIIAALPYLQPLALPRTTRREVRGAHRKLLADLRRDISDTTRADEPPLAQMRSVRPRTLVSIVALGVAFYFLLPELNDVQRSAGAAAHADWRWLAPAVVAAGATYVFAAVSLQGSTAQPVPFAPTLRMQVASSFVSIIGPGSTGSLAISVRYLQRTGSTPAGAATAAGLNTVGGFVMHVLLLAGFLTWARTSGVGHFSLPDVSTALVVIAVVLAGSGIVIGLVPALRHRVVPPLVAQAHKAVTSLADVTTDPVRVLMLLGGSLGVTLSNIVCLVATVEAFGGGVSFPQIGAAYLVAASLGAVAPTPGGLGAVEAALTAALTGSGMQAGRAVLAVLTFRLFTFWLPVLPGWLAFNEMQRHDEL
jgi:glycosyltransferase 2 family protein